jgi:hypothetical protein
MKPVTTPNNYLLSPSRKNSLRRICFSAFPLVIGIVTPHIVSAQSVPATVYMDVDAEYLEEMNVAFVARNSLSRSGSVDHMFFLGTNPAGYPAADTVGFSGGFVGSSIYDFSLEYTASTQTYSFGLTNGSVSGNVGFRGNGANSTISYDASADNLNYNIIHIYGAAKNDGSSVTFSDLVFVPGVGLATSGLLEAAGYVTASGDKYYDQWLAAPSGVNLAEFDWAINARVELQSDSTTRGSDEGIKFEISTKKGIFAQPGVPVPEPSSILLSMLGVISVVARRKRN